MNWNHCSRVAILAALLVVAAAAPVAAVSVSADDAPSEAQIGSKVDVTFELGKLYTDYHTWNLEGQTDLSQVTWTVTTYDQTGAKIGQEMYNNKSFSHPVSADNGVNRVEVRLEATIPEVSSWSYESPQQYRLAAFTQAQEGGTSQMLQSYEVQPYTTASKDARSAMDDAQDAIDAAESADIDVSDAKSDFEDAVEFYNGGNFEQAKNNAERAEEKATDATKSSERMGLLLKAGIGIVGLLLVLGGVYWFLRQRTTHDKLG